MKVWLSYGFISSFKTWLSNICEFFYNNSWTASGLIPAKVDNFSSTFVMCSKSNLAINKSVDISSNANIAVSDLYYYFWFLNINFIFLNILLLDLFSCLLFVVLNYKYFSKNLYKSIQKLFSWNI